MPDNEVNDQKNSAATKWLMVLSTETEFKGSFLFSASKGSSGVEVQERVDAAHRLLDLNTSDQKSRLKFAYGKMSSTNKGADYLTAMPQLLNIARVLPKAPKGAGKNLISVTCDDRDGVKEDDLHRATKPVLEEKGYVVLERVHQARSAPDSQTDKIPTNRRFRLAMPEPPERRSTWAFTARPREVSNFRLPVLEIAQTTR